MPFKPGNYGVVVKKIMPEKAQNAPMRPPLNGSSSTPVAVGLSDSNASIRCNHTYDTSGKAAQTYSAEQLRADEKNLHTFHPKGNLGI